MIPPVYIISANRFSEDYDESELLVIKGLLKSHNIPFLDPSRLDGHEFMYAEMNGFTEAFSLSQRTALMATGAGAVVPTHSTFTTALGLSQLYGSQALGMSVIDVGVVDISEETRSKLNFIVTLEDFLEVVNDFS